MSAKTLAYALFFPRFSKGAVKLLALGLTALSLLNIIYVFSPAPGAQSIFFWFCTVVFVAEYIARLLVVPYARKQMSPARARLRYAFSFMGAIDLFSAVLPLALVWVEPGATQTELVRIICLLRFLKVGRYARGLKSISWVFKERKDEILAAFMLLMLLTIVSSVIMFEVEHAVQSEVFSSPFSGLYWAMTTITTTGYGDMVPITQAGKVVGFCTMIFAIGVVAVPAGIFSAGFVDAFKKYKQIKEEHDEHPVV